MPVAFYIFILRVIEKGMATLRRLWQVSVWRVHWYLPWLSVMRRSDVWVLKAVLKSICHLAVLGKNRICIPQDFNFSPNRSYYLSTDRSEDGVGRWTSEVCGSKIWRKTQAWWEGVPPPQGGSATPWFQQPAGWRLLHGAPAHVFHGWEGHGWGSGLSSGALVDKGRAGSVLSQPLHGVTLSCWPGSCCWRSGARSCSRQQLLLHFTARN